MATKKERIIIEFDFDTTKQTSEAQKLNAKIAELSKSQRDLKKNNEEGSATFQKQAIALKENRTALAATNKEVVNLNTARKAEAGSNVQLKAQLSLLTKEYNSLEESERKTSERGKELDKQINQTTDTLKENEEGVGDNRRSVGDYGKALEGTPFGGFIGGIKAVGAAFIANPIGAIIAAIVGGLLLLKKAFTRSEEGSNKFAKAQAILGGVMTAFLDIIEKVAIGLVSMLENPKEALLSFGKFIKQNIINRFEGLLELIPQLGKAISQVFSGDFSEAGKTALNAVAKIATGVEDITGKIGVAADSLKEFGAAANVAANKAARLADAEAALATSQRRLRIIQLEFLRDAEIQRQIRDDEAKSIEERIAANTKLGQVLQEQSKQELAIANQALSVANQRIALEGRSTANLDERAEALIEIADINERITGQESEQLVNINSLKKEQLEKEAEVAAAKMNAAISVAQSELDIILKLNQSKIEAGKFLNDELFAQEQERLEKSKEAQLVFEEEKLAASLIAAGANTEAASLAQIEYNNAINAINAENELIKADLIAQKAEADKEAAIIDLENKRELDILNGEYEFETRQEDLNRQREQELESAESTGADTTLIEEKYAKIQEGLDEAKFNNKLSLASDTFGNLAAIAGKESAAGKAFAIAQTTIDTFQSATAAYKSLAGIPVVGPVLGGIAAGAAVASGIANVNKIRSTPEPKIKAARGIGMFGGEAHSNGGTQGYFSDGTQIEVEKDEIFAVVNKRNGALISNLDALNQYNGNGDSFFGGGGAKTFLQDGGIGIDSIGSAVQDEQSSAASIVAAVEALPAPVVVVQDINEGQSTVNITSSRAEA